MWLAYQQGQGLEAQGEVLGLGLDDGVDSTPDYILFLHDFNFSVFAFGGDSLRVYLELFLEGRPELLE